MLRIELPTSVLIESGAHATERIYIEVTRFNDFKTPIAELTNGGKDFSNLKPTLYGIIFDGCAMSKKTGEFEYQPMPSSRNEKFEKEFRFSSYEEAKEAYLKFYGEVNPFEESIQKQLKLIKK